MNDKQERPRCPQCGAYLSCEAVPYSATGVATGVDYVCRNPQCMLNKPAFSE